MKTKNNNRFLSDLIYIAMFAAIMAICAQIRLPLGTVPFTLQTLGVFLAAGFLGVKNGVISVLVYILMGAVGLPVFNGFSGGPGVLFGVTGGYIFGFIFTAAAVGLASDIFNKKTPALVTGMIIGDILCYVFGTVWFIFAMNGQGNSISIASALSTCVIPFLIPDAAKIILSVILTKRIGKIVKL